MDLVYSILIFSLWFLVAFALKPGEEGFSNLLDKYKKGKDAATCSNRMRGENIVLVNFKSFVRVRTLELYNESDAEPVPSVMHCAQKSDLLKRPAFRLLHFPTNSSSLPYSCKTALNFSHVDLNALTDEELKLPVWNSYYFGTSELYDPNECGEDKDVHLARMLRGASPMVIPPTNVTNEDKKDKLNGTEGQLGKTMMPTTTEDVFGQGGREGSTVVNEPGEGREGIDKTTDKPEEAGRDYDVTKTAAGGAGPETETTKKLDSGTTSANVITDTNKDYISPGRGDEQTTTRLDGTTTSGTTSTTTTTTRPTTTTTRSSTLSSTTRTDTTEQSTVENNNGNGQTNGDPLNEGGRDWTAEITPAMDSSISGAGEKIGETTMYDTTRESSSYSTTQLPDSSTDGFTTQPTTSMTPIPKRIPVSSGFGGVVAISVKKYSIFVEQDFSQVFANKMDIFKYSGDGIVKLIVSSDCNVYLTVLPNDGANPMDVLFQNEDGKSDKVFPSVMRNFKGFINASAVCY